MIFKMDNQIIGILHHPGTFNNLAMFTILVPQEKVVHGYLQDQAGITICSRLMHALIQAVCC